MHRILPRNAVIMAFATLAVFLGFCSPAQAAFALKLTSSGGATVTITDGGGGDDNGAAGAITFIGGVGGYTINVTTSLSKPILGSAASPHMDLNYITVKTTSGAETLTIEATDKDFVTSPISLVNAYGGTNNGNSSTYQSFWDNGNAEFGTSGGMSDVLGPFGPGEFSGSNSMDVTGGTPYSLTQRVVISANGAANASGNAELTPVPAPPGLVLSLIGIPIVGLGAWLGRRRISTMPIMA